MLAGRVGGARWGVRPDRDGDAGFTLVEVLVALTVLAVVMGSASMFLIAALQVTHAQGDRQVAAQIVARALENARGDRTLWVVGTYPAPEVRVNGIPYTISYVTTAVNVQPGLVQIEASAGWTCTTAKGAAAGRCSLKDHTFVGTAADPVFAP